MKRALTCRPRKKDQVSATATISKRGLTCTTLKREERLARSFLADFSTVERQLVVLFELNRQPTRPPASQVKCLCYKQNAGCRSCESSSGIAVDVQQRLNCALPSHFFELWFLSIPKSSRRVREVIN